MGQTPQNGHDVGMSVPETPVYRSLSVIVPVFNERNTVAEIIRRMRAVALPENLDLEIVVVDDGSSDGTDKILAALQDSTVRVRGPPSRPASTASAVISSWSRMPISSTTRTTGPSSSIPF